MRLSWRIFLISLTIAVLALGSLSIVVSGWVQGILRETSLQRIADNVNRETRVLQRSLDILKADVLVLADLDTVMAVAESARDDVGHGDGPAQAARQRLAQSFASLMQRRPAYAQVRLISAFGDGRELVRVNRRGEDIEVVADSDLQRKGDRYYLDETLRTPSGDIYVSQVDLNRERGRIVEPHEPVFRVGTPVTTRTGTAVGAIVINIFFDGFIGGMVPPATDLSLYVTNENGDFLSHPDADRRFAFEFGRRARVQDVLELGVSWSDVVSGAPKRLVSSSPPAGVVFDRISLAGDRGRPDSKSLIVAAVAPMADLDAQAAALRERILLGSAAIGILLAVALGAATMHATRPIVDLTRAAERISAGARDVSLHAERSDEIGVLSRALSRMLAVLREAARGEEMASMGRMASMVAHDLRNALSSVKMNVQILARRHGAPDDPDAAHLRIATDQIQYMESIVSDMLTFARGDALALDDVELREVLSAAVLAELPAIEDKSIDVVLGSFEGGTTLQGDRVKLVQVFQNLIGNAVQASPARGRIAITGHALPSGEIVVDVVDSGEGVPPGLGDKVFEPFFTTRAKGTGLGLAIVRRIVKEHGGAVELLSAEGGGTVARVTLPTGAPPRAPA